MGPALTLCVCGFCFQARAFFQAAFVLAPHMYEPHYNFAALADQVFLDFHLVVHFYLFITYFCSSFRPSD